MAVWPVKNQWVWVVAMLSGQTTTLLNRLATNQALTYTLNAPAEFECDLPSDDPDVNVRIIGANPTADAPLVAHNLRLLYGLRREEPAGGPPYVCRFGGIITILEDEGSEDQPITHLTAHDPWMWLQSLPVLNPDGSLLSSDGLTYEGKTGDYIAKDVIANAYAWMVAQFTSPSKWSNLPNDGHHYFIDIYGGHFDTTEVIPTITFEQGLSVGEAWTRLTDTGTIDIVLTPVYNPETKPGVVSVMNVYSQAGAFKPNAIFGFDRFPRSASSVDRVWDGTQMTNWAQYYASGVAVPNAHDDPSIHVNAPYWSQKNFPTPAASDAIQLVEEADLALRKAAKRTVTLDPTPERSPDPFTEYFLGDQVLLWGGQPTKGGGYTTRVNFTGGSVSAGKWTNPHRVYQIPITLSDDEVETVTQLLLADPNE